MNMNVMRINGEIILVWVIEEWFYCWDDSWIGFKVNIFFLGLIFILIVELSVFYIFFIFCVIYLCMILCFMMMKKYED